jgi:hypothetical protein
MGIRSRSKIQPRRRAGRGLVVAAVALPLVVLAAACAAGSSTQAGAGSSAPGGGASSATPSKPCDDSLNPVGYWDDATLAGTVSSSRSSSDGNVPMDHSNGNMAGMDHSKAPGTTKPMDMSGGMGEVQAAKLLIQLDGMNETDYQNWLTNLNPNRASAAPDDTGMGGHLGPQTWTHITDPAVCQQLTTQLDEARAVAKKYPKASDAIADGYVLIAPYLSGIASHWMKFSIVDDKFDIDHPEMLLYDGNDKDANLVGLSYFITQRGDNEPTVGFVGGNDHYHRHEGLCVSEKGVIGDSTTSAEDCQKLGGHKSQGAAGWMSHAWVVAGCESPWGVFSAQNPILDQPLVNSSGQGTPCSGSQVKSRWNLSPGTS